MKRLAIANVLARCCELLGMSASWDGACVSGARPLAPSAYSPGLVYRRPGRD
jgi:hypothetical protein